MTKDYTGNVIIRGPVGTQGIQGFSGPPLPLSWFQYGLIARFLCEKDGTKAKKILDLIEPPCLK